MTTLPNLPDIFKDLVSCINIDTTLKKCDKNVNLRIILMNREFLPRIWVHTF